MPTQRLSDELAREALAVRAGAQVQFKLRVDRRKTAAARRKLKFSKDD